MFERDKFVMAVAHCVRGWAESYVVKAKPYEFYRQDDLSCMCAFASTLLMGCLHHFGFTNVKITGGDLHIYLMVDNTILDITAKQFMLNEGAEGHPVEFTSRDDLISRYSFSEQYWPKERKFECTLLRNAFDTLTEGGQHGFPKEQFWTRFCDLKRILNRTIEYCQASGISYL